MSWYQTTAPTDSWGSLASNADGMRVVAVSGNDDNSGGYINGSIYTSNDYGLTWEKQNGAENIACWVSVASNLDGTRLVAVGIDGTTNKSVIYTSVDYGKTWINRSTIALENERWISIASNSTGNNLVLASNVIIGTINPGSVYISSDFGSTWSQKINGGGHWTSVATNSDGTKLVVVSSDSGIHKSIDSGNVWNQVPLTTGITWSSVASNSTGDKLVAVSLNSGIHTSSDSGDTWSQINGTTGKFWTSVNSNSSGDKLAAGSFDSGIYTSSDSGSSWEPVDIPSNRKYWISITSNSDGSKIFAAEVNNNEQIGGIWASKHYIPPEPTPDPIPISNICFPKNTPILTDQGFIPIHKIDADKHTIYNKKIVAVTKTITDDSFLICFEKNAIGMNHPNQKTIMSKNHKIYYKGTMMEAEKFLQFSDRGIKKIKYNGEILYNILMEDYEKINVNNLLCETLHPENKIAKLYNNNLGEDYKNNLIIMMNYSIKNNDYHKYKKILNRL